MTEVDPLAIVVAAVVAFLVSGGYYAAFGSRLSPTDADGRPGAATAAVELVRNLAVAAVVAGLAAGLGLAWAGGLLLALCLWAGFPVVLLGGAVFHERVPPVPAALHAGDWLLKLAAVAAVVTLWP